MMRREQIKALPVVDAQGAVLGIVTVADFVADARASTPTKAGVVAVPDMRDVLADLVHEERRLVANVRSRLDLCSEYLQTILASAAFRNPMLSVHQRQQHVDELDADLADAVRTLFVDKRAMLQGYYEQVVRIEPHRLLGRMTVELNDLASRAQAGITAVMNRKAMVLTAQQGHLTALDPKSVLKRGYSITTNPKTGRVVRTLDDIEVGDAMVTELAGEQTIESNVAAKGPRRS